MLRKYDGCIGSRGISAGEVYRQARYLVRRGTPADEILRQARAHARVWICAQSLVYIGAGELQAGKLQAGKLRAGS